jgi:hypothetical protein
MDMIWKFYIIIKFLFSKKVKINQQKVNNNFEKSEMLSEIVIITLLVSIKLNFIYIIIYIYLCVYFWFCVSYK